MLMKNKTTYQEKQLNYNLNHQERGKTSKKKEFLRFWTEMVKNGEYNFLITENQKLKLFKNDIINNRFE